MRIVTDIQFEHDTMSGKTRYTITKQEVKVVVRFVPGEFGGREIVAELEPIGNLSVELITIGP